MVRPVNSEVKKVSRVASASRAPLDRIVINDSPKPVIPTVVLKEVKVPDPVSTTGYKTISVVTTPPVVKEAPAAIAVAAVKTATQAVVSPFGGSLNSALTRKLEAERENIPFRTYKNPVTEPPVITPVIKPEVSAKVNSLLNLVNKTQEIMKQGQQEAEANKPIDPAKALAENKDLTPAEKVAIIQGKYWERNKKVNKVTGAIALAAASAVGGVALSKRNKMSNKPIQAKPLDVATDEVKEAARGVVTGTTSSFVESVNDLKQTVREKLAGLINPQQVVQQAGAVPVNNNMTWILIIALVVLALPRIVGKIK